MGNEALIMDIIALLIECIVLVSVVYKHMTEGQENRMFLNVQYVALLLSLLDLFSGYLWRNLRGDDFRLLLANITTYGYLTVRHLFPLVYLLFILAEAGILYKIKRPLNMAIVFGTYGVILLLIFSNNFTHKVFSVTMKDGYLRGIGMFPIFILGFLYYLMGLQILLQCRKYMKVSKWRCLMIAYVIGMFASIWQATHRGVVVEAIAYAVMILMSHLFIQRPEEVVDFSVDIYSWWQYREHLRRCLMANHPLKLLVIRYVNASDVRSLMGEMEYNRFVSHTAKVLRSLIGTVYGNVSIYYGPVGCIVLVFDDVNVSIDSLVEKIEEYHELRASEDDILASALQYRMAMVRFLVDITNVEGLISFCVGFPRFMREGQILLTTDEIEGNEEIVIRNQSAEIISRALEQNRFEMYYQPIYEVATGQFVSAEALLRLKDPVYGFVPPATFVAEAERLGFIKQIGHFVLDSVYAFLAELREESVNLDYMEINLSVQQCVQKNLVQEFIALEQKYEIVPQKVNLEVTETMSALNPQAMAENMKTLSQRGYHFSLDDYGTGFSNIVRLVHLPMDIVKIDKSLVDLIQEERCRNIVADTIHMMHRNHMKVVCEGVETKEQAEILKELDCDYMQGFYYARPLPKKEFMEFIRNNNK